MNEAQVRDLDAALAVHGLIARGGFDFAADEAAPDGPGGVAARSVVLVGHAGGAMWPHFSAWRARQPAGIDHPLDRWSREAIGSAAERFGARAVYPSDRPYLPFQRWAMRAEGLRPSPLGILVHPEYGLWHAWRGALLFAAAIAVRPVPARDAPPDHPCDRCAQKPCLEACPVGAHASDGLDHAACLEHVRSPRGGRCATLGCLDRNACPVGTAYRYGPEQQAFHMAAYAGLPAGGRESSARPART